MKKVQNKLRVVHFPQIGSCRQSFKVEVKDEEQAHLIRETLADQHLWLEKNNIIPDYSNTVFVEMYDADFNDETGEAFGWCDYWNEEECMDFDDLIEAHLTVH